MPFLKNADVMYTQATLVFLGIYFAFIIELLIK
jgi:hypothetical protein